MTEDTERLERFSQLVNEIITAASALRDEFEYEQDDVEDLVRRMVFEHHD